MPELPFGHRIFDESPVTLQHRSGLEQTPEFRSKLPALGEQQQPLRGNVESMADEKRMAKTPFHLSQDVFHGIVTGRMDWDPCGLIDDDVSVTLVDQAVPPGDPVRPESPRGEMDAQPVARVNRAIFPESVAIEVDASEVNELSHGIGSKGQPIRD